MSNNDNAETGTLHDYETAEYLRDATQEETDESIAAARTDGGAGVILVGGRRCYVEGGESSDGSGCLLTLKVRRDGNYIDVWRADDGILIQTAHSTVSAKG